MRVSRFGWLLVALLVVTAILVVVAPGVSIFAAAVFVLVLLGVLAEGIVGFGGPGITLIDVDDFGSPKREALRSRYRRGRPEWETTAPDHADEATDVAWERERKRRGLT